MTTARSRIAHPALWVPTAYLAEGIPFALVIWVAGTMFKDLGHSDGEITLATASIGIVWSLKPFWAALLDMAKTKKFFVIGMQYTLAALAFAISLALGLSGYFHVVIGLLWLTAFASATQDICVDGVYITSLDEKRQAAWIGVQGMAWNLGRLFGTALLVWIAGTLQEDRGLDPKTAWAIAFGVGGASLLLLAIHHGFALPQGSVARRPRDLAEVVDTFADTVRDFLKKKQLWGMLIFVLLYRSGEGFLLVEAPLFLQAPLEEGGVGLSLKEKGVIDGSVSTIASILGGLVGGVFIARYGLKRSLFFMALAMNVPHLCFVYLSHTIATQGAQSLTTIATLVAIEKFGYSFGFIANMLYMMQQISPGRYHMTHYAFCTAIMNLGLIPTQMASGPLAERFGYQSFFVFVMIASIPSLIAAWFAPFPDPPIGGATAEEPTGQPTPPLEPA